MFKTSQPITQIKHLGAGVYREWLADGRICVMMATQTSKEVSAVWAETLKRMLDQADASHPFYVICDYSAASASMTPYHQQKMMEVAAYRPEVFIYMSVIVQKNLYGQSTKTFMNKINLPRIKAEVSFSRATAEAWIMDMLHEGKASA